MFWAREDKFQELWKIILILNVWAYTNNNFKNKIKPIDVAGISESGETSVVECLWKSSNTNVQVFSQKQ